MSKTIHAVFENGVFRPVESVDLPEKAEVEFEPRLVAKMMAGQRVIFSRLRVLSKAKSLSVQIKAHYQTGTNGDAVLARYERLDRVSEETR